MVDDEADRERILNRFRRLIDEVMRGVTGRNTFEPWELGILLDLQSCPVNSRRRLETLRRYRRAVERQMQKGTGPPMKLSEFLQRGRKT